MNVAQNSVCLEKLSQTKAEIIFDLINNNRGYLAEWLPWANETTNINDTSEFIETAITLESYSKGIFFTVVIRNSIVGVVGSLENEKDNSIMILNYWIAKKFSNKGIATCATKKIIAFLSSNWGKKKFHEI